MIKAEDFKENGYIFDDVDPPFRMPSEADMLTYNLQKYKIQGMLDPDYAINLELAVKRQRVNSLIVEKRRHLQDGSEFPSELQSELDGLVRPSGEIILDA